MLAREECQRRGDEDAGERDELLECRGGGDLFAEGDEPGEEKKHPCEARPEDEARSHEVFFLRDRPFGTESSRV